MNKNFYFMLISLVLISSNLHAAFEELGAGARPIAMGSAFTAISDDPHAIHYNPAGLAQIRSLELTAGYGRLYLGLKDKSNIGSGFVGIAQSLKQGRLGAAGAGWTTLSLQDAYKEDTISLAYAKSFFANGLFLGATGKLLKRSFGSDLYTQIDPLFIKYGQDSTNYSADFGILYRPRPAYSFGLAFKDINQPNIGLGETERVPLEIRGGFGYHQRHLIFDIDLSRRSKDTFVALGIERWLFRVMGLRAGFNAGSRNKRDVSAGMSYKGSYFHVDYSFLFPLAGVESVSGTHRFAIGAKFGKPPKDKEPWEFEDEHKMLERVLEEKAAQINAMELELQKLKVDSRAEKLQSVWTKEQIEKLEQKLSTQETQSLKDLRERLIESRLESEKMKLKLQEMEEKIQRLTKPRFVPQTSTPPVHPAPVSELPKSYTVQEGDTLQSIALKFYQDESKWVEIYELNSDRIERGGNIQSNQILILPQK